MIKLVLAAILALALVTGVFIWRKDSSLLQFKANNISFGYPKDYVEQKKRAPQRHAESLVKLGLQQPLSIIELNKEAGAIIGAKVTRTPFLDYLENSSDSSLKLTYPNYQKISSERIKISGRDVYLTKFTYTGKDKQTMLHTSFFIIPSNNDAYYLYVQSIDKNRWESDTKKIQSSLKLN